LKIKLRVKVLEQLQNEQGWTDTKLAKQMGISRSRLWRAKLPEDHNEYCTPGEKLINGALKAFPNKTFDDLFFLENVCSDVHKEQPA
jgi:transcriptional regulator with XRE-family HTH domain